MRQRLAIIAGLLMCVPIWAGRQFHAQHGEVVVPEELIIRIKAGSSGFSAQGYVGNGILRALHDTTSFVLRVPGGLPPGLAARLADDSSVEFVEPNRVRSLRIDSPNDSSFPSQWALQTINAIRAWQLLPGRYINSATAGTNRIKVAVLDTGLDCTHPDFRNQGGTSADSANGGQINFSASRALINTTIASPSCSWQDDQGHGTHVAGLIAAATNNAVGVTGIGYPVQLIIYKVLDSTGSGSDSTIANAIMSAADAGAQIISMSLGGTGYSQTLQNAILYAWRRNVIVVCAAGNSNSNALVFPAGATHALGVAATNNANQLASFSNYGNSIGIAAPGVSLLSTMTTYPTALGSGGYGYLSGTSMATPLVAGVAGLLAGAPSQPPAAVIIQRIQQSANSTAVNGGWNTELGYGVVDAFNAASGVIRPATMGAIRGQITNPSQLPIASQITLDGSTTISTTAADGLYRFPSVTVGNHTITITSSGYATQNLTVAVAPGADTVFPVTMGTTYSKFTGVVRAAGVGISGAIVQALSQGLIQATTVTDPSGAYTIWVPGGTYTLKAVTMSHAPGTATETVSTGGTKSVNLTITRRGTVYGRVTSSGSPVANAQITLTGQSSTVGAVTNSNGDYVTIGLVAGTYTLTVDGSTIQTTTLSNVVVGAATDTLANIDAAPQAPAAFTAIRLNAGGPSYTDPQGQVWKQDSAYTITSTTSFTNSPIAGTTTPTLYQTVRYGSGLQYQFSVPNGNYQVTLKFAEIYFTTTGRRIANVDVNSTRVLTNFDIVAAAGGPLTAVDRSFPVSVTGGQIVVSFTGVTDQPMVNAISIESSGSTPPPPPPPPPVGVSVSPGSVTLQASQTQQFQATVTGTANTNVTWSLSPQLGTVSSGGLYTAPGTITSQQTVSVTATSVADPTAKATATVTLTPPVQSFTPIRVKAGPNYTDPLGQFWSDYGFVGFPPTASTTANIGGTSTPALYQTVRYGPNVQYQFTVPNGNYSVTLKFAEIYFTTPGRRIANISINGSTVLSSFDILAQAGGPNIAVDRTIPVNVTNGKIALSFVALVDNAMVNAIEIVQGTPSSVAVSVSPASVALQASQTQLFQATVTGSVNTNVTWSISPANAGSITASGLYIAPSSISAAQNVTVTATSAADATRTAQAVVALVPPASAFTPIRVNAGGPQYTDPQGNVWSDFGYTNYQAVASTNAAVAGTTTPVLYQTVRYGPDVRYQFAVPNGTYTIALKFSEIYFTTAGKRVANVSINGTAVLTNFDILAAAGGQNIAIDRTFPVVVTGGVIDLSFIAVKDNAMVNAIFISSP